MKITADHTGSSSLKFCSIQKRFSSKSSIPVKPMGSKRLKTPFSSSQQPISNHVIVKENDVDSYSIEVEMLRNDPSIVDTMTVDDVNDTPETVELNQGKKRFKQSEPERKIVKATTKKKLLVKSDEEKDIEEIKQRLLDGYENSFWTCSVSKLGYSGTAIISRFDEERTTKDEESLNRLL
ncbi:unnamed protein product [Vicia faba]|uniref:Uncharacterized protein n=1 Tax=Vicia faba TaxID=3906 RepID=A0AAV1AAA8_VICFA|nr:unnamed protein product [Vicia faba]